MKCITHFRDVKSKEYTTSDKGNKNYTNILNI